MRRFKNILFHFEDVIEADQAFVRAAELAERNGAALTLAHCLEGVSADELDAAGGGGWAGVQSSVRAELEELALSLADRAIETRVEVLAGIPFREVIAQVQRRGHDLVVKAARSSGGPRALLFGSTDMHLMRKCPCPVWIHKGRPTVATYGRIMAAVDVADETHVGQHMTRFILDLATSLGQQDDSDVHVVHAWSSTGERMMRTARRGLVPAAEIQREGRAEEQRRQLLFQQAVAPYLDLPVRLQLHLLHGDPREVLPLFARDREMELIVMGTLARTGVPGFFMGNTAEEMLHQVDASVLTLKPEGFLSPVQ